MRLGCAGVAGAKGESGGRYLGEEWGGYCWKKRRAVRAWKHGCECESTVEVKEREG